MSNLNGINGFSEIKSAGTWLKTAVFRSSNEKASPTGPAEDNIPDGLALNSKSSGIFRKRKSNIVPHRRDFFTKPLFNNTNCLRPDHFANITGERPNDREIDGIRGCAQPTISGTRELVEDCALNGRKVFWQNLRSEPVVFIKDEPYALKRRENIRENLKYPADLTVREVEMLEDKLKTELQEMLKKGGPIEIWDQDKNGKTIQRELPAGSVKPQEIKTLTQVYRELQKEYPNLEFQRVPIDDNQRPQDEDYDVWVNNFKNPDPDTTYVVNCQAGKGRTTTAMLVFSMMKSGRENPEKPFVSVRGLREMFKADGQGNFGKLKTLLTTGKAVDLAVNYLILNGGREGRDFMDIIDLQGKDRCNFRHVIGMAAKHFPGNARGFLGTYLYSAAFYRYCREEGADNFKQPFSQWIKPHKAKMTVLHKSLGDLFILRSKFNRYL